MWTWTEQSLQDLRHALRVLSASPLFAAMAALSLALGIGANTAIYSFMDAILLRALPVQNPESLVVMNWHSKDYPGVSHSFSGSTFRDPKTGFTSGNHPYPAYELLRAQKTVCSPVFAFTYLTRYNLMIHGQADLANGQYVSGEFFSGLGVVPAAGRLIDDSDDRTAAAVAVVSFAYAQRRFGDAGRATGESILINNTPFTVVGVAAPGFFGVKPGDTPDFYLPMHANALLETGPDPNAKYLDHNSYWVEMMGRLHPGVGKDRAQAQLAAVFHQFVAATATKDRERADLPALILQPGAAGLDELRRQYSKPLYVLMTLVGLILAIACANIANLLLARATARRREMAVRLSLGAGRLRVVRQLLTESLLLASLGGALGVAFAGWGIRFLTLLIANGRDNFTLHAGLNWNVLGVTLALSLATGLLFGLAPALQATRVDLTSALKQTRAGEPRSGRFRLSLSSALVVSQIAISLLLLVAAGLFVRTLSNLHSVELGFNQEGMLLFTVNARQAGYQDEALVRFYDDLQARLGSIPGVRSASLSNFGLISGAMSSYGVRVPGTPPGKKDSAAVLRVGPSFFTTMQIPILLGREIGERDRGAAVAVVNELFARTFFNGGNPVGRHFGVGGHASIDVEIVGVAKNARYNSLKHDVDSTVYVPYGQDVKALNQMTFELRAAGDPLALAGAARQIVRQADSRIPVSNLVTQSEQIDRTIAQERTFATLCSAFAVLAVLIACVGLYGSMAYNVARRTSEIGIRMALGARRPRLIWMVLREVLLLSAVGLAIGLPVAIGTSRFVRAFLFGMKPNDPLALALAAGILLAAAVAAGYGPAWRASRVDPWTALRDE